MEPATLNGDTWQAEMIACKWCRFYHHGDGTCVRKAPDPTFERIWMLAEDILSGFGIKLEHLGNVYWPSVEKTDFCGDFERGAGLGTMTLAQQKSEFSE